MKSQYSSIFPQPHKTFYYTGKSAQNTLDDYLDDIVPVQYPDERYQDFDDQWHHFAPTNQLPYEDIQLAFEEKEREDDLRRKEEQLNLLMEEKQRESVIDSIERHAYCTSYECQSSIQTTCPFYEGIPTDIMVDDTDDFDDLIHWKDIKYENVPGIYTKRNRTPDTTSYMLLGKDRSIILQKNSGCVHIQFSDNTTICVTSKGLWKQSSPDDIDFVLGILYKGTYTDSCRKWHSDLGKSSDDAKKAFIIDRIMSIIYGLGKIDRYPGYPVYSEYEYNYEKYYRYDIKTISFLVPPGWIDSH